jgi:ethanolamine utilization protein EutN
MNLCKVLGTVVATEKHSAFSGRKLLVVQPVDELKRPKGASFIATEKVCSAGVGDLVLVLREGNGARQLFAGANLPIRSVIVGIVDEVAV